MLKSNSLHFRSLLLVLLHGSLGQLSALHLDGNSGLGGSKTLVAQQLGVHTSGASEPVALGLLDACAVAANVNQNATQTQLRRGKERANIPLRWALYVWLRLVWFFCLTIADTVN